MLVLRRTTPLLCALAFAGAGCGDDGPAKRGTTIDVIFDADGMKVNPTSVRTGDDVTLQVLSDDGRPHGVTLDGAPTPVRVVVTPGQTKRQAAGELPDGTYRVAPDGATEPVEVTVGP